MKRRLFNFFILILTFTSYFIYSQTSGNSKFLEMKNSFILGLTDKGLEIASELLSRPEHSAIREETVFYVAELFFVSGIGTDDIPSLNRALTYYTVYNNDYPSSMHSDIVAKRINTLESFYGNLILFRNLDEIMENEAAIVEKKLSFASKTLYWFSSPNVYKFFTKTDSEQSSVELLDRYFDEIIVNNPEFEVYAFYYKIIARLSKFTTTGFVKEGLLEFNESKVYDGGQVRKSQPSLETMLKPLSEKYPSHPLVLELHLLYANIFMYKIDDKFDITSRQHLEFVVQNELDKTHPRYLMAKEFLLSNKFL